MLTSQLASWCLVRSWVANLGLEFGFGLLGGMAKHPGLTAILLALIRIVRWPGLLHIIKRKGKWGQPYFGPWGSCWPCAVDDWWAPCWVAHLGIDFLAILICSTQRDNKTQENPPSQVFQLCLETVLLYPCGYTTFSVKEWSDSRIYAGGLDHLLFIQLLLFLISNSDSTLHTKCNPRWSMGVESVFSLDQFSTVSASSALKKRIHVITIKRCHIRIIAAQKWILHVYSRIGDRDPATFTATERSWIRNPVQFFSFLQSPCWCITSRLLLSGHVVCLFSAWHCAISIQSHSYN